MQEVRFESPEYFRALGREELRRNPSWITWLEEEIGEWIAPDGVFPGPLDITQHINAPECITAEGEFEFRRGFHWGIREACEHIYKLKRKGFLRPTEIANILWAWSERDVRNWKNSYRQAIARPTTPTLTHDTWATIRRRVFDRDGNRCVECGSEEKLEADHINPVCDGGLPLDDNLRTLCKRCHRPAKLQEVA